jgi:glc operon protein GlcG
MIFSKSLRRTVLAGILGQVVTLAPITVSAQQPSAPPPQVPYGSPITLDQAKKVMNAAEAEAKKNNWNVVIAVLDSGGHIVITQRLDGAQLGSIDGAREKAYSAVMFRRPTKSFQDSFANNLRIIKLTGANPIEGGVPIVHEGKLIGAVGVSGALSQQDAQIASAGSDVLK